MLITLSLITIVDTVSSVEISSFAKLYEPSGVVQLRTGEVMVVEDEGDKPLYISLPQQKLAQGMLGNGKSFAVGVAVDDLEGITSSRDSRNK
ncbi:hypothetical protein [Desulfocastanea catecholica]